MWSGWRYQVLCCLNGWRRQVMSVERLVVSVNVLVFEWLEWLEAPGNVCGAVGGVR